jgi:hypothetical protein
MPLAGFEPAIPATDQLQTHALDRSVTGVMALQVLNFYYRIRSKVGCILRPIYAHGPQGRNGYSGEKKNRLLGMRVRIPPGAWIGCLSVVSVVR